MSDLIERVARALSVHDCGGDDTIWNDDLDDDLYKDAYRRAASVAIKAIDDAPGWQVMRVLELPTA